MSNKIQIKKGGSIWQLGTLFGQVRLSGDLCTAVKSVVLFFLLIALIVVGSSYFVGDLLAAIAASIVAGKLVLSYTLFITLLVCFVLAVVLIIGTICWYLQSKYEAIRDVIKKTIPNNFNIVYKSWKEKYCPLVEGVE